MSSVYRAPGTSHTPVDTLSRADWIRPTAYSVSLVKGALATVMALLAGFSDAVAQKGTCQSTTKLFTAPPVLMAWVR